MSFYEVLHPTRLNDVEWRGMLNSPKGHPSRPDRPEWVSRFMVFDPAGGVSVYFPGDE
jgi:hypothetical protein